MRSVLLIITGGIAAYKALEVLRLLQAEGVNVRCVLTSGAQQFITPLSAAALSGAPVYTELFSLKDESEMGHIRLAREADAILVCPASADFIAKAANGLADDLASTLLLAAAVPVYMAPAMNGQMWQHPAVQENTARLEQRGVRILPPDDGIMACGETGQGRLPDPARITNWLLSSVGSDRFLSGKIALVTSGPTREPIDPVRYISNYSSGRQGHAIAAALRDAGASVTLVHGPVALAPPPGVNAVAVETAQQMLAACMQALPVDIAVCAAAVADWTPAHPASEKIKKTTGSTPPAMTFRENPDILQTLATHPSKRPSLVVGFALETDTSADSEAKRKRKGCDWLLANHHSVGAPAFDSTDNALTLHRADSLPDVWPRASKSALAKRLVQAMRGVV